MKFAFGARRTGHELEDRAAALRSLAALLRAGVTPRDALIVWHEESPHALHPSLQRLSRRLALGESTSAAIELLRDSFGLDGRCLQALYGTFGNLGGDLARSVDELARTIESRRAALQDTFAAVAGMTLSGRIVAGIPLLCLPLLPASDISLMNPATLLLVILGVALAALGMGWMKHLTPHPSEVEDGISAVARSVAVALRGGACLGAALEAITRYPPEDSAADLDRARKLNLLGLAWADCFRRTGNSGLVGISVTLDRAARKGLPTADGLEAFAAQRDAATARQLDRMIRRAPVLMAVPLVACVLPSFLLLGVVPFLRGFAL